MPPVSNTTFTKVVPNWLLDLLDNPISNKSIGQRPTFDEVEYRSKTDVRRSRITKEEAKCRTTDCPVHSAVFAKY